MFTAWGPPNSLATGCPEDHFQLQVKNSLIDRRMLSSSARNQKSVTSTPPNIINGAPGRGPWGWRETMYSAFVTL